jgi:hypothetical protein
MGWDIERRLRDLETVAEAFAVPAGVLTLDLDHLGPMPPSLVADCAGTVVEGFVRTGIIGDDKPAYCAALSLLYVAARDGAWPASLAGILDDELAG